MPETAPLALCTKSSWPENREPPKRKILKCRLARFLVQSQREGLTEPIGTREERELLKKLPKKFSVCVIISSVVRSQEYTLGQLNREQMFMDNRFSLHSDAASQNHPQHHGVGTVFKETRKA